MLEPKSAGRLDRSGMFRERNGNESSQVTEEQVRGWAASLLPRYQVPRVIKIVDQIPRNSMGKVNKKELAENLFTCSSLAVDSA
jgi:acyl-CoA synthetase (AMP-forming)/AMP-acid ligase II